MLKQWAVNLYNGFTLIEMAISLIILGLLANYIITPLKMHRQTQQYTQTSKIMAEIKDALLGFAVIHRRLPFANTNADGSENTDTLFGFLPWKDLGIGRFDAWGQQFRYAVDSQFTIKITDEIWPNELEIKQNLDEETALLPLMQRVYAPAVIWSVGQRIECDSDKKNNDDDGQFIYDAHLSDMACNDTVRWLNIHILQLRLIKTE
ncbi:MAG: prepilin-type N-terminal cleavage/methylation domain-containing protein [Thiomargarita sp.]|nr:prepilin-type N-terminal cleavage/methylation domain-containing protein [Thiomargarita sp.]